jgi:hypothetical protein
MTLDESARLYLADYYLLEQARSGAHRYLEEIANRLAAAVRQELKTRTDLPVVFGEWLQKDGGHVSFYVNKLNVPGLDPFGEWKYNVAYSDAMRTETLSESTKCRLYGFTAKSNAAQAKALERAAQQLGLPDPYLNEEFDLLAGPLEEVVETLALAFTERLDNHCRAVEKLSRESIAATS